MRKLSKSQRVKVDQALAQHERFRSSYMWRTYNGNRQQRALWSERETWSVAFRHEGVRYQYDSSVSASARNVYYKGRFSVDGKKATVRALKNLVGAYSGRRQN